MTDAPELKPCPFCGGVAADPWFDDQDGGSERGEVYCTGCSASTHGSHQGWARDESDAHQSINQAITAWNTRADIAKPRVKPLVWHHITSTGDRNVHEAKSLFGRYTIWPDGSWRLKGHYVGGYGEVRSLSGAKAAAQADYETRVLACLE